MRLHAALTLLAAQAICAHAPPSGGTAPVSALSVAPRIDSADLARFVDTLIAAQMAKENIPGAVFLLVKDGKVLYQRGYGFPNVARLQPVDPERTIWRIGSISKVFTATAVAQLADRGRF